MPLTSIYNAPPDLSNEKGQVVVRIKYAHVCLMCVQMYGGLRLVFEVDGVVSTPSDIVYFDTQSDAPSYAGTCSNLILLSYPNASVDVPFGKFQV